MKKLILLYGLPGSGKSTLAKKLEEEYESQRLEVFTIETDEWFVNARGVYKFDPSKLGEAHRDTFLKVVRAMIPDDEECSDPHDSYDVIILSNTNLTWKDIKKYVALAVSLDYEVEIVETDTPWRYDLDELEKRGVHNVPREVLEKMNTKRQSVEYLREKVKLMGEEEYKW